MRFYEKYSNSITWYSKNRFILFCKSVKKIEKINKKILAPVRKGDVVGSIVYTLDGNEIGRSDIIAKRGVQKAGFSDYLIKVSAKFLIGEKN